MYTNLHIIYSIHICRMCANRPPSLLHFHIILHLLCPFLWLGISSITLPLLSLIGVPNLEPENEWINVYDTDWYHRKHEADAVSGMHGPCDFWTRLQLFPPDQRQPPSSDKLRSLRMRDVRWPRNASAPFASPCELLRCFCHWKSWLQACNMWGACQVNTNESFFEPMHNYTDLRQ